ncbi:hypothetical protein M569_14167 [Genlisea aurea]|uniref:very-long-chain 3-oxoacyl-CoA synthase n=1 Tax=Genlisea aurea TaxID=192259 RepID=S8DCV4_9LAMI|nr:hypothetical protein M569_14167 [Genlisea aurea]
MGTGVRYWLVHQPLISQYEWKLYQTPGATPRFVAITVAVYLALTLTLLLLHRFVAITVSSATVRRLSALHSLALCLLSIVMAVGTLLSVLHDTPPGNPIWAICFPVGETPPRGATFFWAHVFYFSKILEFVDTLLILLGDSRNRRLSFLHVYHHAAVVVLCYLWLAKVQSLFPVALVANAAVHVLMYGYYFLCAVGRRPAWKRLVTNVQILQFLFSFAISGRMLHEHFFGSGCEGFQSWCFNAVFNASLLILFFDFHSKSYAQKTRPASEKLKSI